tara:strand:+ start:131 stop:319 length:189 start_codon:yes stop_codon:yes gene_type:complete
VFAKKITGIDVGNTTRIFLRVPSDITASLLTIFFDATKILFAADIEILRDTERKSLAILDDT